MQMDWLTSVSRFKPIGSQMLASLVVLALISSPPAAAQAPYLSSLTATKSDPIFTTYAAPIARSNYIVDEGYRFTFYDEEEGIRFSTDHSGDLGVIFRQGEQAARLLPELHEEPTITTSYSDLVKYTYSPFEDIRVDAFFQVYSSSLAVQRLQITNEGGAPVELAVIPFLHHDAGIRDVASTDRAFTFAHTEVLDDWMRRKQEKIPYVPERIDVLLLSDTPTATGAYPTFASFLADVERGALDENVAPEDTGVVAFLKNLTLANDETQELRIVRGVAGEFTPVDTLRAQAEALLDYDVEQAVAENEEIYAQIPQLDFENPEHEMMYWGAYNLIRHLFMAPEGKSSHNHYVYSREPTWGWGYGGQVLHESITMLAYAFMDGESAQNSQRVYMERQWPNGYIYYRIGPYLDEFNYTRGEFTSSAPWFNWENWEIYQITGDREFLEDAYASGTKFYNWWMTHRDADNDGLAEWGGHAILESIRDAKVALWRDVGWPSNFESPDLNAMLVKEARALSMMAEELGNRDAATSWRFRADVRADLVRQEFWDEEDGFFYYLDKADNDFTFENENDLKRREIVGFFPMWAGIATEEQAARLVEDHLTDPEQFWRPYGIPSLSASDPFYEPQGYWNGPVWVELNYLVFRGLLDYGYQDLAREMADRIFANVIHHLREDHTFWEFYSPEELWAGYHQTYIWTGIVARMLIDLHETSQSTSN